MSTVIKVEQLSKHYRLGILSSKSFREDLQLRLYRYRNLGAKRFSFIKPRLFNQDESSFWALKDVSFEVKQGEVLGIVGKNGAGKSTLLKILSKVTSPTSGKVKIRGRVASLLEVGTGFHPDLTGRENIFMNGAILGMSKKEILSKFEEIVEFSGVGQFIDTPVKKYSSGMYVRLAFAVAAHLEPEILIVDEVLAVGDAEFQKKCLGKMKDVAGNGRTVLFVSHNMGAISSLCSSVILLKQGSIVESGDSKEVINAYFKSYVNELVRNEINWDETRNAPGDEYAKFLKIRLITDKGNNLESISVKQKIGIEITYEIIQTGYKPGPNFLVLTQGGEKVFQSIDTTPSTYETGIYRAVCWIPPHLLNDMRYIVDVCLTTHNPTKIHASININIDVLDDLNSPTRGDYKGQMHGVIRPLLTWETNKIT